MATTVTGAVLSRGEVTGRGRPPNGLAYVASMHTRTQHKGCLWCIKAGTSMELLDLDYYSKCQLVSVPTNICSDCLYENSTTLNRIKTMLTYPFRKLSGGRWCYNYVHKTQVVVCRDVMDKLTRQNTALLARDDPAAGGNAIFLMDGGLGEYQSHLTNPMLRAHAYTLHMLAAHAISTEPGNCEYTPRIPRRLLRAAAQTNGGLSDPPGTEHGRQLHYPRSGANVGPPPAIEDDPSYRTVEEAAPEVIAALGAGPFTSELPSETFGRVLFGETVAAPGEAYAYDALTEVNIVDLASMNPRYVGELLKERAMTEIASLGEKQENESFLKEQYHAGHIKAQGVRLLPGDPKQVGHAMANNAENILYAAAKRHMGPSPVIEKPMLELLEMCSDVYFETLKELSGGGPELIRMADQFLASIPDNLPKSWGPTRTERKFLEAVLVAAPAFLDKPAKTGLPRMMSIKKAEWLTKIKPRGIIAAGDVGCVIHTVGPTLLDYLELNCNAFLCRSVKHATKPGLARRVGALIAAHSDPTWLHSNDDFGSYDASLRQSVRDATENRILEKLHEMVLHLTGSLGQAANKDRNSKKKKIRCPGGVRITSENLCRESGDKGTSVLNRVDNKVLTASVLVLLLLIHWGLNIETFDLKDLSVLQLKKIKAEVNAFYKGTSQWADLSAEGDDGLRWWRRFLFMCSSAERIPLLISLFARFGFNLEPQSAGGRDAVNLEEVKGRYEFVSIVFCQYTTNAEMRVRLLPKPRRLLDSLSISFVLPRCVLPTEEASLVHEEHAWVVLRDKALALLMNTVDCPLLFRIIDGVYRTALKKAGPISHLTDAEDFLLHAGYNAIEMCDRFGPDVASFYGKVHEVRTNLSSDKVGDATVNRRFVEEMIGSSSEGSCLRMPMQDNTALDLFVENQGTRARDILDGFARTVEDSSPDTLVSVWGCWRRAL